VAEVTGHDDPPPGHLDERVGRGEKILQGKVREVDGRLVKLPNRAGAPVRRRTEGWIGDGDIHHAEGRKDVPAIGKEKGCIAEGGGCHFSPTLPPSADFETDLCFSLMFGRG
jgi:hypothetical protein